jgi:hypothetical protein
LERGSKQASSRAPGKRPATAASVSFTARGWWAKSSTTVTPPARPRTSWRRFTPPKAASPAAISAGERPSAVAAAATPSAFSTFWAPPTGRWTAVSGAPRRTSVKRAPSAANLRSRASQSAPGESTA